MNQTIPESIPEGEAVLVADGFYIVDDDAADDWREIAADRAAFFAALERHRPSVTTSTTRPRAAPRTVAVAARRRRRAATATGDPEPPQPTTKRLRLSDGERSFIDFLVKQAVKRCV
jgi:hypothetical protein